MRPQEQRISDPKFNNFLGAAKISQIKCPGHDNTKTKKADRHKDGIEKERVLIERFQTQRGKFPQENKQTKSSSATPVQAHFYAILTTPVGITPTLATNQTRIIIHFPGWGE
jgi:hypothetical protein